MQICPINPFRMLVRGVFCHQFVLKFKNVRIWCEREDQYFSNNSEIKKVKPNLGIFSIFFVFQFWCLPLLIIIIRWMHDGKLQLIFVSCLLTLVEYNHNFSINQTIKRNQITLILFLYAKINLQWYMNMCTDPCWVRM